MKKVTESDFKALRATVAIKRRKPLRGATSFNTAKIKPKRCKNPECKVMFVPSRPFQRVCGINCSIKLGRIEDEKKDKRLWNVKKTVIKDKVINYKKPLQDEINKIVRLLDFGLPCLARGTMANQMHAGHVFARGGNQPMRYNLHNLHRQSAQSNHFQNDDGLLREGLVKEYGQPYMDFISGLRSTPELHYSNLEYKEFLGKARKIVRELKQHGNSFALEDRILLRNHYNLELGIYDKQFCLFQRTTKQI